MLSGFVQRLLLSVAFAAALLLAPALARAALLPACEAHEQLSQDRLAPALDEAELASACESARNADDAAEVKVAALCDARGLSAVAPQRILPIVDARIEAGPSCTTFESSGPMIAPSPDDAPTTGPTASLPGQALLAPEAAPNAPSYTVLPPYLPVGVAEHLGVERAVYHPPR